MKKYISTTFFLVMCFIVMVACSSNTPADNNSEVKKEPVKLKWTIVAGESEMPGWQGIADAFNNSRDDIFVELERMPGGWEEYLQKMTALIASGNPPDIGRINPVNLPRFATNGQVENLYPYLKDIDFSQYFDIVAEEAIDGDKMFGAPIELYTQALFYNKTMFDDANLEYPSKDWNNPWTWDDLRNAAAALTKGTGATKQFGINISFTTETGITPYLYANGGSILNDDKTKTMMNSPEAVQTLDFIQSLVADKYATTPADTATMPSGEMFRTGRLGMFTSGQWGMLGFSDNEKYEWGVAAIPKGPSASKTQTTSFMNSLVIYKGSEHVKEAAEVIKFFIGEEAAGILADNGLGGIPLIKKVAEEKRPDLFRLLSPEDKEVWFQAVDFSKGSEATANFQEILYSVDNVLDLLAIEEINAVDAGKKLEEDINKLLK